MYQIYVSAQFDPKEIPGSIRVRVGNCWMSHWKKISNLITGDRFLFNGAWYTVASITRI